MPTYEYACERCDHEFDVFQSITARPLKKCPACGERSLRRLIGRGGGVIFKGSGFYQTDYRSESYKKAAEAEKKAHSGDSGGKDSDETESKAPKPADSAGGTAKTSGSTSDPSASSKRKAS